MAKPQLVDHRYDFRGGRNTAISPDLLNPNELVDCTNARLSAQYGGFTKRTGCQRIHSAAFPAAVNGVTQWDSPAGKQVVVISNGSLWWRNGFDLTQAFQQVVPASIARTTANQGNTAGWPDLNGGVSSISQVGNGTAVLAAGNRQQNKLGDPGVDGNIPSIDGTYVLQGYKITADATALSAGTMLAITSLESSVDNGGSYQPIPASTQQVEAAHGVKSTVTVGATTFSIAGAPTHVWIRVLLTVQVFNGGAGTATGSYQIFNTAFHTDNYPVTWFTGSAQFATNQPAFFAPFRKSAAGAPLVLYIASGGHYWAWDGSLTLTQFDAPPNAANIPATTNIVSYHTRMFAMSASSITPGLLPKTIFWSTIGNPEDFTTGNKSKGGSAVTDFLTGQQLTALEVIGSSLLMSTADSVMRFTGHASDDIVISQDTEGISAEVGSVSAQTLRRFENVAAMLTDRGPYVVTETYSQPLGEQLNPDWQALDTANLKNSSIEYNRFRKELLFAVPRASDGGTPKTIFSQSVRLQAWQGPWVYPFAINCQCKYFDANNLPNTLAGGLDGFVRLMDVGNLDDVNFDGSGGANITMTVEIPVIHFGLPGLKKALHWMLLQANLPIGSNLQVNVSFDGAAFTNFPVVPNDTGEEDYRVDNGGDTSQGFRCRIQFVDASPFNVTINGFTQLAWNMQRTT